MSTSKKVLDFLEQERRVALNEECDALNHLEKAIDNAKGEMVDYGFISAKGYILLTKTFNTWHEANAQHTYLGAKIAQIKDEMRPFDA